MIWKFWLRLFPRSCEVQEPRESQKPAPSKNQSSKNSASPLGKKLLFILAYALFMVLTLAAVLGEVLLRVLPLGKFRSAPFRQYDSELGVSLVPNMKVTHSRGCFTGQVETNRWGFRDRDRTLAKPPGDFRIALVGDSVVEGVHVNPDQVMNIQMEKLLQQKGYHNVEGDGFRDRRHWDDPGTHHVQGSHPSIPS